eukprot:CAMPEP_0117428440 /NCGR_PEP_ID=MMETSP0758-20121206/8142_1 /TAXON_ID=63605 /ORGANISM="Percolomonas cosmopolitus, Strain AE-1 (ATCC 50343)" /LENGTH=516 /DNA_ID=CAMNT_0005214787 /DNA_START=1 /DNA_END=1548 /DNA_ORIENTATION=-
MTNRHTENSIRERFNRMSSEPKVTLSTPLTQSSSKSIQELEWEKQRLEVEKRKKERLETIKRFKEEQKNTLTKKRPTSGSFSLKSVFSKTKNTYPEAPKPYYTTPRNSSRSLNSADSYQNNGSSSTTYPEASSSMSFPSYKPLDMKLTKRDTYASQKDAEVTERFDNIYTQTNNSSMDDEMTKLRKDFQVPKNKNPNYLSAKLNWTLNKMKLVFGYQSEAPQEYDDEVTNDKQKPPSPPPRRNRQSFSDVETLLSSPSSNDKEEESTETAEEVMTHYEALDEELARDNQSFEEISRQEMEHLESEIAKIESKSEGHQVLKEIQEYTDSFLESEETLNQHDFEELEQQLDLEFGGLTENQKQFLASLFYPLAVQLWIRFTRSFVWFNNAQPQANLIINNPKNNSKLYIYKKGQIVNEKLYPEFQAKVRTSYHFYPFISFKREITVNHETIVSIAKGLKKHDYYIKIKPIKGLDKLSTHCNFPTIPFQSGEEFVVILSDEQIRKDALTQLKPYLRKTF